MLNENIKIGRKSKELSQDELAIKLNVVRQTVSKWERGLSVPDSEMLISLSEILEIPVSELLGENIELPKADELEAISQKLEVVNIQLAQKKGATRKFFDGLMIALCVGLILIFFVVRGLDGSYLNWDYKNPELAAAGVLIHGFEWIFIRFSGSDAQFFGLSGSQLIQHYAQSKGLKQGIRKYNYFITEGKHSGAKDDGILNFKKGFGGYLVELPGEFHINVNKFLGKVLEMRNGF